MKWKKLGKIFDPTTHPAFSQFKGYAQSPQTLELEDRIRVYFSIRKADESGKFISYISFVDYDKEFKGIINTSTEQVIELGDLGTFDEHGIFPINPLQYEDKIYAYTCGWSRRVSVSVETSTGLAISNDGGYTFKKIGHGPVFSSSLHEPFLVGDSFVRVYNNVFHMWYIYGTKWTKFENENAPDRVYKIAHATSNDGLNWQRDGRAIVHDKLNDDECQALPSVLYWNGRYHMFFCYRYATGFRNNKNRGYRIGYAYSDDLEGWNRDDELGAIGVSESGWDSDMLCYPHIFQVANRVYLLYNGNEFGKYGFGLAILEG
ncbi:MAG: hypothetical protein ABI663_22710 [Chryseolinea sp.]